jgi:hypothetical protein
VFLNKGLPEYRVEGTNVALTILRAVSQLSRPRLMTRGSGAGPNVATPEANCLGMNEVSYGWAPLSEHSDSEQLAQAYRLAELFEDPVWASPYRSAAGESAQALPLIGSNNRCIRVVAMYTSGKGAWARLLNVSHQGQSARLTVNLPGARLWLADPDERVGAELRPTASQTGAASVFSLDFAPNQLLTLCLASGKHAAEIAASAVQSS